MGAQGQEASLTEVEHKTVKMKGNSGLQRKETEASKENSSRSWNSMSISLPKFFTGNHRGGLGLEQLSTNLLKPCTSPLYEGFLEILSTAFTTFSLPKGKSHCTTANPLSRVQVSPLPVTPQFTLQRLCSNSVKFMFSVNMWGGTNQHTWCQICFRSTANTSPLFCRDSLSSKGQ